MALTVGEKDGGLAGVALTIGEAKVKGNEGGVEGTGGSYRGHIRGTNTHSLK